MSTFAQTRSTIRRLESECESLISDFSSFAQSVSFSATGDEVKCRKSIDDNLGQRQDTISALQRIIDTSNNEGNSATRLHQLQRHKEILADDKSHVQKIRSTIQQERNRANLLTNVRDDINDFHNGSGGRGDEAEYMLQERSRVDNSNSMADNLLAQAYETRDEFVRQSASLSNVQRKLLHTVGSIPGISSIIAKVNTRKKRDSLIIASLIAVCLLFLFFVRG
ncbi:Golgi SNAP receptor complex member 1 [Nadsonia fulvescens var. elongata DSM 6958]|uniref:Golgi SNAP receptor complex member 1 n=1 Tax=Nadsonia fulvescens var. elongata DSM 6958 TaxID=857566 RepID=A0A1E3PSE0_9ASCO|nr:Golgi SNAP receptor complex member 1 [Nadsonia fulvescens var. elongata DSM 6958]